VAISLGERLRQVVGGSIPRLAPDAQRPGPDSVPVATGRADVDQVASVLGGYVERSQEGAVVVVDRYYGCECTHGRDRLGDIVETIQNGSPALGVLARAWPGRDGVPCTPRLCFFDLETTGLAGGAGTQAFLVGCAVLDDGGVRVHQFLLPGFEHERALLAQVGQWLPRQGTLVTFNGRSFDVPLIETRYLLHRVPFPLADMPHLDMLHPARRLWKDRPAVAGPPLDDDSCRLSVLERHLAGYHRVGDVPGFEIPSRYFQFVRDGNARPLEAILEHNRLDLISLALVTARALTLIGRGPAAAAHPHEALGLARVYERAGNREDAEAAYAYTAALAGRIGPQTGVRAEALRRLALCRRRAGRMADAAAAWQELLVVPGCSSALRREAREALAIHHEHRSRDLRAARAMVMDVLAESAAAHRRAEAEYRLRRIERKIAAREKGDLMAALEAGSS
jgi:uncharacterized protein